MVDVAVIGENLEPMRLGLQRLGYCVEARTHYEWSNLSVPDFAVIFGLRAQGRDIMAYYKTRDIPVVVVDHGFINRVNVVEEYSKGYFYVGMNGLGNIPKQADDSRSKLLGYSIKPPRVGPIRKALITGQVAYDASHHMDHDQLNRTYENIAAKLKADGIYEVRFRGHPQCPEVCPKIKGEGVRRLSEALDDCDLVCTINSNSGLDALLHGLPVAVLMHSHYVSLSYPMSHDLSTCKAPPTHYVQGLVNRLSFAQYTASEMLSGVPIKYLVSMGSIPSS